MLVTESRTDIIGQLGALAFASRLKRLSERLMKDASRVYETEQLGFEARWFPVFYLLWRQSPLAVTIIAQKLHLSHPAINQVAGAMARAGLIISARDQDDDRRRLLSLSPSGRKLARQLEPIWRDIQAATAELVAVGGADLLGAIERIEKSLDQTGIYERVRARIKKRQFEAVEILDYTPRHRKRFKELNFEWLKKYFAIEPIDRKILDDPEEQIIKRGGQILFARLDRKIVGTVALLKRADGNYELAKMTVTEAVQRSQVGTRLALAAIDRARIAGAQNLLLFTSPILVAANALYRQLGFVPIAPDTRQALPYSRPTIAMRLELNKKSRPKPHRRRT